tara:strand:- start:6159 stop:7268 length:1110 start_codon:yes stop_codon:yes gene_type:complete
MLRNKIYTNYFLEIIKTFLTIILGLSLIALTVRAVNFLELIIENGYSLKTYFFYSILNIFGIAPKFFPLAFLISLIIFILKHKNNSEFIILWSTGVKKTVILNLLLFTSFAVMFFYLIFSTYLTPMALNKSRQLLSETKFNSFLPTIRSQQFSDSFEDLTFFVEKKINNEVKNVFLYDTGNNLRNFSSNNTKVNSTTIIAEQGIVKKKSIFLINGQIISNKKLDNKNEIIIFEQLNINLDELTTTVIKAFKLQETSTLKLLSCFTKKSTKLSFCNSNARKEIIPVLIRRIILPTYIPILALICSFLLIKNENLFLKNFFIFSYSFFILVFVELILKYTGTNEVLRMIYFIIPILMLVLFYPLLNYKFSK